MRASLACWPDSTAKQTPSWPAGLSVNAILSVIVTVMKGAMGICVAECLSQIKWTWFKQHGKLIDLVIIDEASRGILGAARLLTTLRAWYLAYIGTFGFLAAFLIGPTVQQMVQVKSRTIDLPINATVPICNKPYYKVMGLGSGDEQNKVILPVIGAMYDGFLQTSTRAPLRPYCPTGTCTYPRYQSLGLCHECIDYSDQLVHLDPDTNETTSIPANSSCFSSVTQPLAQSVTCSVQWPEAGLSLNGFGMIDSMVSPSAKIDPSLGSSDNTTLHFFRAIMSHAWQSGDLRRAPTGVQCLVRVCVKTYESSVDAGNFKGSIIATSSNDSYFDDDKT